MFLSVFDKDECKVCLYHIIQCISFSHHCQGSVDFNTVNIHGTVGMHSWYSLAIRMILNCSDHKYPIHFLLPRERNVSILYPPIQEEMRIRRNIARGPFFSVISFPLGLGGTIQTLYTRSCPPQARAIKLHMIK